MPTSPFPDLLYLECHSDIPINSCTLLQILFLFIHCVLCVVKSHFTFYFKRPRACDIMHNRLRICRGSRNSLRHEQTRCIADQLTPHHRLRRFLIATGGATPICAHDRIWADIPELPAGTTPIQALDRILVRYGQPR